MNHAKIAAALHALADAFLADVEAVEQAVTGKGKGKAKAAEPAASAQVAPAAAAAEPAPASLPAPTVSIADLNKAVLKLAAKNRDAAVAVLAKFGITTTVGLATEKWQPVYDAFEEEIAKQDAAAVQVQQASLV